MESHADARMLLVRQYLCDWEHDRAATLTIESSDTVRQDLSLESLYAQLVI